MEAQHNAQQETAWKPLSIAVVAPYSFGHAIPAAFFAVRLANAGHSVAFLTSAGLLRNIKALLLQEEAWSANEVEWVALHDGLTAAEVAKARGAYQGYGELPFFMGLGRERMAAALLPHIEQLRDAYDTWVIDAMAFGAWDVLQPRGITPYVLQPISARYAKALGILGKDSATAAHLLTSTTPPFARQYYQDVITECRSARGLLLLSCDAIEEIPQEWRRPQLRLLGPMAPPCSGADISGTTLGQWLDSCAQHKEPVVFVSMGSHIELSEEQVEALAQGLDDARWCVVWAISAAANARLPPALHRRRFFFTPWAPQRQVLAHEAVAAAVLHCGWGGVTEAAAAGVPIVAAPFVGDQPFNAAALQAKGTGVAIANWPRPTASDVKAAVAAVVGNAALAARAKAVKECLLKEALTDEAMAEVLRGSLEEAKQEGMEEEGNRGLHKLQRGGTEAVSAAASAASAAAPSPDSAEQPQEDTDSDEYSKGSPTAPSSHTRRAASSNATAAVLAPSAGRHSDAVRGRSLLPSSLISGSVLVAVAAAATAAVYYLTRRR